MTPPKDYPEQQQPMSVQDRKAEVSSRYSALFTGLIFFVLTSFFGTLGWGFNHFSDEFIDFKEKVIDSLYQINSNFMKAQADRLETRADVRVLRKEVQINREMLKGNGGRITILEEINRK